MKRELKLDEENIISNQNNCGISPIEVFIAELRTKPKGDEVIVLWEKEKTAGYRKKDITENFAGESYQLDLPSNHKEHPYNYDEKRKVNNRLFEFKPAGIAICFNTEHVQAVMKSIHVFPGLIRVCSGRHDHEGESMGDDALVIDLSEMNKMNFQAPATKKDIGIAYIQPGMRFNELIPELNRKKAGIPHGTCFSVAVGGYSFGGGWGPWTRVQGMGCESLIGAIIVLGNGERREIWDESIYPCKIPDSKDKKEKDAVLWALKGGGGMSYGIVTLLVYKTFSLPHYTAKFVVSWEKQPGFILPILKAWEDIIYGNEKKALLGTNLKIIAQYDESDHVDEKTQQVCYMYGYYQVNEGENGDKSFSQYVADTVRMWFDDTKVGNFTVTVSDGLLTDNGREDKNTMAGEFAAWDRVVDWHNSRNGSLEPKFEQFQYIPVDKDGPAPRKITSKLALDYGDLDDSEEIEGNTVTTSGLSNFDRRNHGLGTEGLKTLIRSLRSPLIGRDNANVPPNLNAGLRCFATIGAISGPFYTNYNINKPVGEYTGSSFPYKESPYTIQYQAWWQQGEATPGDNTHKEKAIAWIRQCRNLKFPQTRGAFISFKDADIPTKDYFQENYEKLKQVKIQYSQDPFNRLSSNKTIM